MTAQHNTYCFPKRFLICGLGSIGCRHVRILSHNWPDIELGLLRSGHGREYPELNLISKQFSDLSSAVSWKPDAAVIASPAPFHQRQALLLARNGIPILIEKPVGIGSEPQQNWEELVQLSSKVPIAVGYVLRHDPCADYIKDKLVKQELGKVLEADFYCGSWLPDWRSPSDYRKCVTSQRSLGGDALLEISHEIDMALWFLDDFQIVFALLGHSNLLEVDVEDQVLLVGCGIVVLKLLYF